MRKIKSRISSRIETGTLQINDDWAGLFVRGDDCRALLEAIEKAYPLTDFGHGLSNLYDVREALKEICGNLTQRALDLPCTCPKFENGTKVFPMRYCDGCRNTASQ